MGEKDIAEKILMDNDDVFADVVNGFIFDGKPIVEEINLSNVIDKSQYKISGKIHEQERDVAKVIECDGVKVMYVGIENQTDIDVDETKRVIGYDGAVYRGQVIGKGNNEYSDANEHSFRKFRAPLSGKTVHVFPEVSAMSIVN